MKHVREILRHAHAPGIIFHVPGAPELVHQLLGIPQSSPVTADDGVGVGVSRFFFIHRLPAGKAQHLTHAPISINRLGLEGDELCAAGVRGLGQACGSDVHMQILVAHTALDRIRHRDVDLPHEGNALCGGQRFQRHGHTGVNA